MQAHDTNDLHGQLGAIQERLRDLELRVDALETGRIQGRIDARAGPVTVPTPVSSPEPSRFSLPLVGRVLLILSGAFLLRAVTESGVVTQVVGAGLGVSYAIFWMLMAARAAARHKRVQASVDVWASMLIGCPLLWEMTVTFDVLSPAAALGVLAALTTLGLLVGWRYRLRGAAVVVTLGAAATCLALGLATHAVFAFVALLLLLSLATVWLAYSRGWVGLAVVTAALANATVFLLTATAIVAPENARPLTFGPLLGLQCGLLVMYVGSFAVRMLRVGRDIGVLEILQTGVSVGIGLGGAILVRRSSHAHAVAVGLGCLLLAAICYAISFACIDRRSGRRFGFIVYSSAALLFAAVGFAGLLSGAQRIVALAAAALVLTLLGAAYARATLSLHGAVFVLAAAIVSGLLEAAAGTLVGANLVTLDWLSVPIALVLGVSATSAALSVKSRRQTWGRFVHAPKLVVLAILTLGLGAVIVSLVGSRLIGGETPDRDRAVLAMIRTVVLAVATVALAWAGRQPRFQEARLLVYPVLLLAGAKLLYEDLRLGQPAMLAVSLVAYGSALIVAPRLRRRRTDRPGETTSDSMDV